MVGNVTPSTEEPIPNGSLLDGELTYLELQAKATAVGIKLSEAMIEWHKNTLAREENIARDPSLATKEYQALRDEQNDDIRAQAQKAVDELEVIVGNLKRLEGENSPAVAKLAASLATLRGVAAGNAMIGTTGASLAIANLVGDAYAKAHEVQMAAAAEAITEYAKAAAAQAVHRAVERQRQFYPELNDDDWSRIEILSNVVTPKNMDKFAEALFADDTKTPAALRKSHAQNFVTYGTETESGKELIATHNTLSIAAPNEMVQSNAQLTQQNKDIDALLAKGGLPKELEDTLKQVRTSRIFSAPLMEQINAYKNAGTDADKALIQQKIIAAGEVVVDQRLNEDLPRLKEIAKTVGLTEEQLKQQYGIGYGDTVNSSNRDAVLRGLKDVHENVKWMTHPESDQDRARNAAADKVCAVWDELKGKGLSDEDINKELLKNKELLNELGFDKLHGAVRDAGHKKAHAVLTAAGKTEDVNDSTMDKALGEKVEAQLKIHGPKNTEKVVDALAKELKNDSKYSNKTSEELHAFCVKTVDAVKKQDEVEAVCEGGHCKLVHKTKIKQPEPAAAAIPPHLQAARNAAGPLAASGTQAEQSPATNPPAAQLLAMAPQRAAKGTAVSPT